RARAEAARTAATVICRFMKSPESLAGPSHAIGPGWGRGGGFPCIAAESSGSSTRRGSSRHTPKGASASQRMPPSFCSVSVRARSARPPPDQMRSGLAAACHVDQCATQGDQSGSAGDQRSGGRTGAGQVIAVPVVTVVLATIAVTRTLDDAEGTLEGLVLRRRDDLVVTDVGRSVRGGQT